MRAIPSRKLDKRITRVWRLSALLNILVLSLVILVPLAILAYVFAGESGTASGIRGGANSASDIAAQIFTVLFAGTLVLAVLLLVIFVVVAPRLRWMRWSFEVGEEEIDILRGIIWRTRIIIPLIRVQNVDTKQGPVMRANGLASFTVATAAGEHEIPGLPIAEADALRDHVAVLARIAQEDV
ncbi:MAG: PH domain-containing protein [Coriobacteriales bacterium]|jgi:membrane protein YdbS with pleckstrin-like domain|nr:PH domain-containing protein [Coriobacteriales bacterium]